jgi:predicted amidohydrolase
MGTDGNGVAHRGDSSFIDPLGEVLSSVSWEEGVVIGDVDVATVTTLRDKLPFLADRRPDVYRTLESSEAHEEES